MSKRLLVSLLLFAVLSTTLFPKAYAVNTPVAGNENNIKSVVSKNAESITIDDSSNNFTHADCDCEKEKTHSDHFPLVAPSLSVLYKSCLENCGPLTGWLGITPVFFLGSLLLANSHSFYLLTIASLIAFFSSWYLRFRSGQAPGEKHFSLTNLFNLYILNTCSSSFIFP